MKAARSVPQFASSLRRHSIPAEVSPSPFSHAGDGDAKALLGELEDAIAALETERKDLADAVANQADAEGKIEG